MTPILFRAKSLKDDEWVTGYYAHLHIAKFDDEHRYLCHEDRHAIFNDKCGDRSYWTDIDISTMCQLTPMTDAIGHPIWEYDRVRLYQLTRKIPNAPLHHYEGMVIFLSSCYAVLMDDGHTYPIVTLRKDYDMLTLGSSHDQHNKI